MSETRMTPEEIAADASLDEARQARQQMLDDLRDDGYVIVHPDDVPMRDVSKGQALSWSVHNRGWNSCRAHIFGESTDA